MEQKISAELRKKTACFTGHRHIPPEELEGIKGRLEKTIIDLYGKGIIYYGAGGARGFDSLAAETVLRLRDNGYPRLRLILVLPCLNQTKGWRAEDIARYNEIKQQANKTVYTSREYTPGCMYKRNRHLVDNSSVCICYQTQPKGGTAYTVHYARDCGLDILNVA